MRVQPNEGEFGRLLRVRLSSSSSRLEVHRRVCALECAAAVVTTRRKRFDSTVAAKERHSTGKFSREPKKGRLDSRKSPLEREFSREEEGESVKGSEREGVGGRGEWRLHMM